MRRTQGRKASTTHRENGDDIGLLGDLMGSRGARFKKPPYALPPAPAPPVVAVTCKGGLAGRAGAVPMLTSHGPAAAFPALPPWLSKKPGPSSTVARGLLGSVGKLVTGPVPVPAMSPARGRGPGSTASTHSSVCLASASSQSGVLPCVLPNTYLMRTWRFLPRRRAREACGIQGDTLVGRDVGVRGRRAQGGGRRQEAPFRLPTRLVSNAAVQGLLGAAAPRPRRTSRDGAAHRRLPSAPLPPTPPTPPKPRLPVPRELSLLSLLLGRTALRRHPQHPSAGHGEHGLVTLSHCCPSTL